MIVVAFVDWAALWQSSVAALVAGIGVTFSFSLAIYGVARSAEERRMGRPGTAVFTSVLGFIGLILSLAAVAVGLSLMIWG
jgi:hypothetical protein